MIKKHIHKIGDVVIIGPKPTQDLDPLGWYVYTDGDWFFFSAGRNAGVVGIVIDETFLDEEQRYSLGSGPKIHENETLVFFNNGPRIIDNTFVRAIDESS